MASDHKFDISLSNMEKTFPHQKETFYTHQDMDVFLLIIFMLVSYRTAEPILLNCNTDVFSFIIFFPHSLLTTVLSLSPVTSSCTEIYCVTDTVKSTYVPDSFHLTDTLHVHWCCSKWKELCFSWMNDNPLHARAWNPSVHWHFCQSHFLAIVNRSTIRVGMQVSAPACWRHGFWSTLSSGFIVLYLSSYL